MKIIVPMAGRGTRFYLAGYNDPKPLVDVAGKPMIQRVIENITPKELHKLILITRAEHEIPKTIADEIIELDKETEGAVDTILKAEKFIDDEPLLIANCDQITDIDLRALMDCKGDGCVAVFKSNKPHHSYVTVEKGFIDHIAEKVVISSNAVTGIYYFKRGLDFVEAAHEVMSNKLKVKDEYYVSTVLDVMIAKGKKLSIIESNVGILGTPEELQLFLMAGKVWQTL